MIPSHLIECGISEATCVVNARGEAANADYDPMHKFLIVELEWGNNTTLSKDQLYNACLTPCKPKPVFVEAVSVTKFVSLDEAISNPKQKIAYGKDNAACFYFNPADLTGIENIPPDQLEIVLRRKVSNNA